MMESKPSMDMSDESCMSGHCHGAKCSMCGMSMHHMPLYRFIFGAVLFSALFAAGYIIGEAKGRLMDGGYGWRGGMHSMQMMNQGMMMPQGRMMMQNGDDGSGMMMPNDGSGSGMMMQRGTGTNGVMMMATGTKY